jgi:pyruvate dehydrogenase E2 component (dihydrolipoamide acetyltransferase)
VSQLLEIAVPDIGDFDEVEVVEILVAKGDRIEFDDPLVSVESDKATMEIPSTSAGVVVELRVAEGDKVSEGSILVVIDIEGQDASTADDVDASESSTQGQPSTDVDASQAVEMDTAVGSSAEPEVSRSASTEASARPFKRERELSPAAANPVPDRSGLPHASPLARRFARELGVPITGANGTGPHGRILVEDLKAQVRDRFAGERTGSSGAGIPPMPAIDHSAFGPVHEEKLSRIQRVSGPVLHRSWLNVPHVTQHDEADVTELERFRRDRREAASERGLKLSPLLFVMKAVVIALGEYPTFRASLAAEGDRLVIKDYFHLGIAVDTDQGLVVPVIRDVDRKGIYELSAELNSTAERARARKLGPDDLRGACFTISSLGGIGGTAFSPIVNAPEVAILGLSKSRVTAIWDGPSPLDFKPTMLGESEPRPAAADSVQEGESAHGSSGHSGGAIAATGSFTPRLMLPFSLSYDHRVIDGAEAARFTSRLSRLLSDPIRLLL